jgi:hypothetical protein
VSTQLSPQRVRVGTHWQPSSAHASPAAQAMSQAPQFDGSRATSTQPPSHAVKPVAQATLCAFVALPWSPQAERHEASRLTQQAKASDRVSGSRRGGALGAEEDTLR